MEEQKIYGKNIIIGEPFSIKNRKYCNVECSWCGKKFKTQLRQAKKGKGCLCKTDYSKFINKKINKLTIIRFIDNKKVECKCECGKIKVFNKFNVLSEGTISCGCEKHNYLIKKNTKHNKCKTRIYQTYMSMKARCFNKKSYAYKWYGGRGIKVCNEWLGENGFHNFYNWAIENKYNDDLSLERIDVNGNYEPNNCTWIPISNQQLNTSKSIKIESNGKYITVKELSKKYNIPKTTLYSRIKSKGKKIVKEKEIIWEY